MVYTFNELSLYHEASSLEIAQALLTKLVEACVKAKRLGITDLRLNESHLPSLYNITIFPEYNIGTWLKDERIDDSTRTRFKEIITSTPLIQKSEIEENDFYDRSEFKKDLDGKRHDAFGLGAAYIFDTISLSFATHQEWEKTEIEIIHYYVNESLEETTNDVTTRNISCSNDLNIHSEWLGEYQKNALAKSAELWEKKNEFFPSLEFCEEIKQQLDNLGISKTLSQVIDRLRELDRYVKEWKDGTGDFNYKDVNQKTSLRISPESTTTLNKFGTQRKFFIPGQGKNVFDLHIKTGDLRFHFYPDNTNRKLYIGYIGKHLRIASEG